VQLLIPAVFVSIIILGTLASFLVVSQEGIDVEFEMTMMVDSNTTLWNAGYHYFEFEGSGWFKSSVINETAYLEGSGTVDYGELVPGGSPGFPPGEFSSHFELMGYLSNNMFTGPFSIDGDFTGVTTALPGPYDEGFIYAESLENLKGSFEFVSSFADRPLNITSDLIFVDFGY